MDNFKILIIEDEKNIARFLELELTHEGYRVGIEHDGREGLKRFEKEKYDLVILDIMLPGLNGLEILRRIRKVSNVPIIMLTAKDDVFDKVNGLDAGADDYVTKPFSIEELLARIRVVKRKIKNDHRNIYKVKDLTLNIDTREVVRSGKKIDLTKKEYELLEYLIRNKGIVLSREKILQEVWGYDFMGDTNVVDVYIRYLRSKIDDDFGDKIINTIRGVGYAIKGE